MIYVYIYIHRSVFSVAGCHFLTVAPLAAFHPFFSRHTAEARATIGDHIAAVLISTAGVSLAVFHKAVPWGDSLGV